MNAPVALQPSASDIMMDTDKLAVIKDLAKVMAQGGITVPKHLQGSTSDCFAVCLQAAQWGMNPFVVAQKTHVVSGTLGYEAQLVNAVIQNSGMIEGAFKYEYRAPPLACRVGARLRGDSEITWGEWLAQADVKTQNSPLWKTNPKQQLAYLQVKNFARLYAPGAILGVYSTDELASGERDITPAETVKAPERNTLALEDIAGNTVDVPVTKQPVYAELAERIKNADAPEDGEAALNVSEHLPDDQRQELAHLHLSRWGKA